MSKLGNKFKSYLQVAHLKPSMQIDSGLQHALMELNRSKTV